MSSHSRPICGICRKWSITHRLVKPAASAARATSASVDAVVAGMAGPVEARDLQPEVERHRILLLAGGRRGGGQERGRDERDGSGGVDAGEALRGELLGGARPPRAAARRRPSPARGRRGHGCGRATSAAGASSSTAYAGTPCALRELAPGRAALGVQPGRVDHGRQPRGAAAWRRSGRAPRTRRGSRAGRARRARRPRAAGPTRRPGRRGTSARPSATSPTPVAPTSTTRDGSGSRSTRGSYHSPYSAAHGVPARREPKGGLTL